MTDEKNSRYVPLIQAIIKHSLIVSSGLNDIVQLREGIEITMQEWLVVEAVVEQRNEFNSMVEISRRTGIPASSFFRFVSRLQKLGLVEKYHIQGNKKSIVLRPSELALELYNERTNATRNEIWGEFEAALDQFSDSEIAEFTDAFKKLTDKLPSARYSQEFELVKV